MSNALGNATLHPKGCFKSREHTLELLDLGNNNREGKSKIAACSKADYLFFLCCKVWGPVCFSFLSRNFSMSAACANPTAWQLRGIIDHAIVIDDLFSIEHDRVFTWHFTLAVTHLYYQGISMSPVTTGKSSRKF